MLEYRLFTDQVKNTLQEMLGELAEVTLHQMVKNNNVKMDSIVIRERGSLVSPAIYIEPFYQDYIAGTSFADILEQIMENYQDHKSAIRFDMAELSDYEKARHKVVPRIVNAAKNHEILNQIPHMEYQDLAIIYYYLVDGYKKGAAGIQIRNEFLDMWGISAAQLKQDAYENMNELLPPDFCSMQNMLEKMLGHSMTEEWNMQPSLYVLSNQAKSFGAVWITDERVLEMISRNVGGEYYVLPSSVHECLIIPAAQAMDEEMLISMVKEVNETSVDPKEVLSDHIYRYNQVKKTLILINEKNQ